MGQWGFDQVTASSGFRQAGLKPSSDLNPAHPYLQTTLKYIHIFDQLEIQMLGSTAKYGQIQFDYSTVNNPPIRLIVKLKLWNTLTFKTVY